MALISFALLLSLSQYCSGLSVNSGAPNSNVLKLGHPPGDQEATAIRRQVEEARRKSSQSADYDRGKSGQKAERLKGSEQAPGPESYVRFTGDCVDDKGEHTFMAHYGVWGEDESGCASQCSALKNACKGYVMKKRSCRWLWVDTQQHVTDWNSTSKSPIAGGDGDKRYACYRHELPTGLAEETDAACHTAVKGDTCHRDVTWAMESGIHHHPEWYTGLTEKSTFEDFQELLHKFPDHKNCHMPCRACHTAVKGDTCHRDVTWAMEYGIHHAPQWYTGLTEKSTFEDFQELLHKTPNHKNCPIPCSKVKE